MPRPLHRSAFVTALLLSTASAATAQSLSLDTNFGAGGTTVMSFPSGWWTDWDDRDAHLINQGGAFSNSWVVAGSHRTLIGSNLFHRRGWGFFSDSLSAGTVSGAASEAGPPLSTRFAKASARPIDQGPFTRRRDWFGVVVGMRFGTLTTPPRASSRGSGTATTPRLGSMVQKG